MCKVVIIGTDHSNALGVIRSFGENGIKPYVIIVSDTKFVAVKKSKYIEKYFICKDDEEAILTLIDEFKSENKKPVLIPTSDKAVSIIDYNYNRLKEKFIVSSINEKQGEINFYMDKYNQYLLAKENGLLVANSYEITFPFNINYKLKYPVIVKPLVSVDGRKNDIKIVKYEEELNNLLANLKKRGYKRLLIQEMIEFDYECDMSGYCYNKNVSISGYIKKHRIWPLKRGSLTFGEVKTSERLQEKINRITNLLVKLNYNGLFDIEFFVKKDEVYLNEINFRNSGLTYLYKDAYICYNYFLSCINDRFIKAPIINKHYYVMDELAEIHQIIEKNISLKQHFKDKKKVEIFLINNKKDKRPAKYFLLYKMCNNLHLKKILKIIEKGFHKNKSTYLLKLSAKEVIASRYNHDYEVIEINEKNIHFLLGYLNLKSIKKELLKKRIRCLVLQKNGEMIGYGILKQRFAKDRFLKIINKNSYAICNIFVLPKYRGNNYQCDIVNELISKIKDKNYEVFTVVYKYNIPSWRNFEKINFKIIDNWMLFRVLKCSVNKKKV